LKFSRFIAQPCTLGGLVLHWGVWDIEAWGGGEGREVKEVYHLLHLSEW
jgi:hypothetical protein